MDKKYLLRIINAASPNLYIAINRRHEKRGQKDSRRKAIAGQFSLTKEQKEQIDDLFMNNYGEKIPYSWHQYYAAHSGKFDCRYFPELLYIPEFEYFQNHNGGAVAAFSDKNLLPIAAKSAGVKMPQTIVSCTNGILRDGDNGIITPVMATELVKSKEKCFVKPSVDSCSGQGCVIIDRDNDVLFGDNTLKINRLNGVCGGGIKAILLSKTLSLAMRVSKHYILVA